MREFFPQVLRNIKKEKERSETAFNRGRKDQRLSPMDHRTTELEGTVRSSSPTHSFSIVPLVPLTLGQQSPKGNLQSKSWILCQALSLRRDRSHPTWACKTHEEGRPRSKARMGEMTFLIPSAGRNPKLIFFSPSQLHFPSPIMRVLRERSVWVSGAKMDRWNFSA